jgi:NAD(P)-dependent dehydrogenase (short-subunit alcohol dehydrogenase family)
MKDLFSLEGQSALITGSSRGIGKAVAEAFVAHGAKVVISSRKEEACEEVAADLRNRYGEACAFAFGANITDPERLQALVDVCKERWGRIDHLVANAAINPAFGPSKDVTDEQFHKIFEANVLSAHRLSHMVAPDMIERRHGTITVVASIAGLQGNPVIGTYGVSKAANMQLVRNLAVEYGQYGVRANAIAPGLVRTDFARALWEDPDILKASTRGIPLRRIGEPDEIAGIAVYLASRAGSYTNGTTVVVDGGLTTAWN